jgi:hypothetical protein
MYQIYNTITGSKVIHRLNDSAWIPLALDNTDYQAYLKWVAEGNVAEEVTDGN